MNNEEIEALKKDLEEVKKTMSLLAKWTEAMTVKMTSLSEGFLTMAENLDPEKAVAAQEAANERQRQAEEDDYYEKLRCHIAAELLLKSAEFSSKDGSESAFCWNPKEIAEVATEMAEELKRTAKTRDKGER